VSSLVGEVKFSLANPNFCLRFQLVLLISYFLAKLDLFSWSGKNVFAFPFPTIKYYYRISEFSISKVWGYVLVMKLNSQQQPLTDEGLLQRSEFREVWISNKDIKCCPKLWSWLFMSVIYVEQLYFQNCNGRVWPTEVEPFPFDSKPPIYTALPPPVPVTLSKTGRCCYFFVWCEVNFVAKSISSTKVLDFWR
jgi:hypothetical protein